MHGEEAVNMATVRIIKHEAIPGCGSFLGGLELCKLALQGVVTVITQALPLPLSEPIEVLSEPQPACRIS